MGLGRVYHAGSGALSVGRASRGSRLQLVESVLAHGRATQAPRGDHRPSALDECGGLSEHAHQRIIRITPLHAFAQQAIARLQAVSAKLKAFKADAQQLPAVSAWQLICRYIRNLLLAVNRLRCPLVHDPGPPKLAVNCGF